jgi:hypothetical protein
VLKSYRTAIECKFWKKKVDKDVVMKLSEVIEDTGIEKGVIVSKGGFTKDALAFAKHKNIGLVELKESTRNGCNESQSTINIGSLEIRSQVTRIRPEILSTALEYIDKTAEANDINFYSTSIKLSDGREVPLTYYTSNFQRELHNQNRLWQTITKRYEMEAPCLICLNQKSSSEIKALTFTGMLTKHDLNSNLKLSLVDQVWLTMKLLFEEQGNRATQNSLITT